MCACSLLSPVLRFLLLTRSPPPATSTLPYTTLFRSRGAERIPRIPLRRSLGVGDHRGAGRLDHARRRRSDRKSTRLNSSHRCISYAVFCLKKKNNNKYLRARAATEERLLPHKDNTRH